MNKKTFGLLVFIYRFLNCFSWKEFFIIIQQWPMRLSSLPQSDSGVPRSGIFPLETA